MIRSAGDDSGRLLVIHDIDRLGPIVRACFAPNPISGVRDYVQGIAELPLKPTRAVLVGYDPDCESLESAIAAIKNVAGNVPVVMCCEPAFESVVRRLLEHGADDYVIFPPEARDLERALGMPSQQTQKRWIEDPVSTPAPTAEELALLAELLPRLNEQDGAPVDAMAALVRCALGAEDVVVVLDGLTGRSGDGNAGASDAVLIEPISRSEQRVGQIRVGRSTTGGYSHEDSAKLRHYGVLIGRLLETAERARQWRHLANTDDLTSLPNRRGLMAFLEEKLETASKSRSTVTVLVFDIDDFKRYNDEYGHDAGDEILRDIGQLFVQCSREQDLVARYGGDEFVVVFWDAEGPRTVGSHHPKETINVLRRFQERLKEHTFARLGPEATGRLTISGGLAQYPWQGRTAPELIEAADQALLQAKAAGKNRFWLIGSGDVSA